MGEYKGSSKVKKKPLQEDFKTDSLQDKQK
jgi:hypothetical protein